MTECNHICAAWGVLLIKVSEYATVVEEFRAKVEEFDTTRKAVPHPGQFITFQYCPQCGKKIEKKRVF
jgi:hypothetical protein